MCCDESNGDLQIPAEIGSFFSSMSGMLLAEGLLEILFYWGDAMRSKKGFRKNLLGVMVMLLLGCTSPKDLNAAGTGVLDPVRAPVEATSTHDIVFGADALRVQYGTYSETEFTVTDTQSNEISWQVPQAELPAGLELQPSTGPGAVISGVPQFTGEWCF